MIVRTGLSYPSRRMGWTRRCVNSPGPWSTLDERIDMTERTPCTSAIARLLDRIEVADDGCWVFTGSTTNGYGVMSYDGQRHRTHRLTYEFYNGPIPDGLVLDHLCRNRACCNPDHLEPVTHRENTLRGVGVTAVNASKTHCPAGHPYTPENTRYGAENRRFCIKCDTRRSREFRARRREAKAEIRRAVIQSLTDLAAREKR